ncbi:hypothetical protein HPB50_012923 [Hyalomma asiaticum]|uniref:Uncharacterized protein n=1 Tax=Hyalomma asiaticum TaxID=266040 RepID=A0ACB7RU54_HYAAI|nr:hypothetical protein HPB50_012923 [Hyalomma asiaticum]
MADPVFAQPTSPSPRHDTKRTPARRRAASVQCSRMLQLLTSSAEAVRIQHERNERLLRATETRPFNPALPDPVVLALGNLPMPAADDTAALAAATTSAVPAPPDLLATPRLCRYRRNLTLKESRWTRRPRGNAHGRRKAPMTRVAHARCRPSPPRFRSGPHLPLTPHRPQTLHLRPLGWSSPRRKGDGSEREPQLFLQPGAIPAQARRPLRSPPSTAVTATPVAATTAAPQLTVLFRPTGPGAVFPRTTRISLAKALSALAGVRDVRMMAGIPVGARLPADHTTSSSILQGILGDHAEEELLAGLESEVPVLAARRQGTALILDIAASVPPARVRHFRMAHQVRACRPHPLQCQRCGYGHATATCAKPQRCLRCGGGPHGDGPCAVKARCIHCGQAHAATSPKCQLWQKERHLATIKATAPTFIPHREAKGALRQPPVAPPVPPPTSHPGGLSYAQAAQPVQK